MNWVPITGTFTAGGDEKYLLLGNFKSDATTNSVVINPTHLPTIITEVLFDDVSVFELDAPAYAGPDQFILSGDSVYIGSPRDFAADEACTWYLLPNSTVAVDTAAGMWVKPTSTSTYVVRQQLWCSGVKWDTVTVHVGYVGIDELAGFQGFEVYPSPAVEQLVIRIVNRIPVDGFFMIRIFDHFGRNVKEETLHLEVSTVLIGIQDLVPGVYFVEIDAGETVLGMRRIMVMR